MDRTTYPSTWMREDPPAPRRSSKPAIAPVRKLTAAEDALLLQAWTDRQALSNRALEKRLGLTKAQLERHLLRVRREAGK